MPIYEYYCAQCELRFELRRSYEEAGEWAHCPQCKRQVGRVPSAFGLVGGRVWVMDPTSRPSQGEKKE